MSLEKIKIGEVIYDVIDVEEYYAHPDLYGQYTAVRGYDGYVYPIRNLSDTRPGFYPTGCLDVFKTPYPTEGQMYSVRNIINFKDTTSLRDVIITQQRLMNAERSILTTIDNVFVPEIGDNDTPEMKALKEAIIEKHIDLDKYEQRFGPNYNNDKRLMKKERITFEKFRFICDALDIKATLVIEDANSDVPNPIGNVITTELTGSSAVIDIPEGGGEES